MHFWRKRRKVARYDLSFFPSNQNNRRSISGYDHDDPEDLGHRGLPGTRLALLEHLGEPGRSPLGIKMKFGLILCLAWVAFVAKEGRCQEDKVSSSSASVSPVEEWAGTVTDAFFLLIFWNGKRPSYTLEFFYKQLARLKFRKI